MNVTGRPRNVQVMWQNRNEAARCVNTRRPLTHPFDADEGRALVSIVPQNLESKLAPPDIDRAAIR